VPLEQWNVLVDSEEAENAAVQLELDAFRENPDFPIELRVWLANDEDAAELMQLWSNSPGLVWARP